LFLFFTGCKTTTHTTRKTTFKPNRIELRMSLSELEVAGETEITVSYTKVLGFSLMNEINGIPYDQFNIYYTNVDGISFGLDSKLKKALGKVIDEYPKAAFYYVIYHRKNVTPFMFGKEIKETALIRAYTIKQ